MPYISFPVFFICVMYLLFYWGTFAFLQVQAKDNTVLSNVAMASMWPSLLICFVLKALITYIDNSKE